MAWTVNLQKFLQRKMDEEKIKSNVLADRIGIPLTTFRAILNLTRKPEMKNIIKIADYYECSIDDLLNKKGKFSTKNKGEYTKLSLEELSSNLRSFIKKEMAERGLNQYQLGRAIGHSDDALRHFLREGSDE